MQNAVERVAVHSILRITSVRGTIPDISVAGPLKLYHGWQFSCEPQIH